MPPNTNQNANPKLELIEELPLIVKDGHREVAKILERIQSESKITLQTKRICPPKSRAWHRKHHRTTRIQRKAMAQPPNLWR